MCRLRTDHSAVYFTDHPAVGLVDVAAHRARQESGDPTIRLRGPDCPHLVVVEVALAIYALNRKFGCSHRRMLRNLNDQSIAFLTDKIDEHWKSGFVPPE
ncbi:hypothetical protein MTO96_032199 [Rhipicephalus appendiculatus]